MEEVLDTSTTLVIAGFVLLLGVSVLASFAYMGRGEVDDDGRSDLFGSRVTMREITARYRTTWAPSKLFVSIAEHQRGDEGSPVYGLMWGFLIAWLACTGVFLVIVGAFDQIKVVRAQRHLDATICVALALGLCAVWVPVFRLHSKSPKEVAAIQRTLRRQAPVASDEPLPDRTQLEEGKSLFLWVAFFILVAAWTLALLATVQIEAWTLPGPQYGTMLFVAPGYGLFTGWLLFAASLNFGIAYCADSCPDGVRAVPSEGSPYAYRASPWPIAVAGVAAAAAVSIPDPTQPVPLGVAILLFAPPYAANRWAAALGAFGIALGALRVWMLR